MTPHDWCLADQTLAAFVDGALPDAERRQAIAHVDACPDCFHRVAVLAAMVDAPAAAAPAALIDAVTAAPRPSRRARLAPYAAVAAGIVLAVALWARNPVVDRVAPATDVRTSPASAVVEVDVPRDNDALASGFEVRWRGPAGTVFYEVQLTTADGDRLWSTQVSGDVHRVVVPTTLSAVDSSYLWVTAHLPEGRRLASNVIRVRGRAAH